MTATTVENESASDNSDSDDSSSGDNLSSPPPSSSASTWLVDPKNKKLIFGLYGLLNGINDAYILKYYFDISAAQGKASTDTMHDWLISSGGTAFSVIETAACVACSIIANVYSDDKKEADLIRYIVRYWPYFREFSKALRQTYKGVRSVLQTVSMFGGADLRYLLIPFALIFGAISVVNRIWHKQMYKQRKDFQKANHDLKVAILNTKVDGINEKWVEEQKEILHKQTQSDRLRYGAFFSVTLGAVLDSFYQYMGIIGLAALTPPFFIAMFAFCALYGVVNIITRIYEEHDYQCKLHESALKIRLVLCGKELQKMAITHESQWGEFQEKHKEFSALQTELHDHSTISDLAAFLAGLKMGLTAYSVVTGMIFAIATFTNLFFIAFPPLLLVACVLSGFVCLVAQVAYTMFHNNKARVKLATRFEKLSEYEPDSAELGFSEENDNGGPQKNQDAREEGKVLDNDAGIKRLQKHLDRAKDMKAPDLLGAQDLYEVPRQFFGGVNKSRQVVSFAGVSMMEQDDRGHCHDTSTMAWLTAGSSLLYASEFAVRSAARAVKNKDKKHEDARFSDTGTPISRSPSTIFSRNRSSGSLVSESSNEDFQGSPTL